MYFEEKISKVNGEVAIKKYQRGKLLGISELTKAREDLQSVTKLRIWKISV